MQAVDGTYLSTSDLHQGLQRGQTCIPRGSRRSCCCYTLRHNRCRQMLDVTVVMVVTSLGFYSGVAEHSSSPHHLCLRVKQQQLRLLPQDMHVCTLLM